MCEDNSRTVSVHLVNTADLFANIYRITMIGRLVQVRVQHNCNVLPHTYPDLHCFRDFSELFKDVVEGEEAADVRGVFELFKDKDVVVEVSTDVKSEMKTKTPVQPAAEVPLDEGTMKFGEARMVVEKVTNSGKDNGNIGGIKKDVTDSEGRERRWEISEGPSCLRGKY